MSPSPPRRHRRAVAPATNPDADPAEDTLETPAEEERPPEQDPRERWILAQRPPHWD